ncbi:hypothetical protein BX600DRAFT_434527 [Xylariales sp. PMI_506]|nr:hypothetical protein BX600DRAFT_434527 [Xylariales sp. PMI_506]
MPVYRAFNEPLLCVMFGRIEAVLSASYTLIQRIFKLIIFFPGRFCGSSQSIVLIPHRRQSLPKHWKMRYFTNSSLAVMLLLVIYARNSLAYLDLEDIFAVTAGSESGLGACEDPGALDEWWDQVGLMVTAVQKYLDDNTLDTINPNIADLLVLFWQIIPGDASGEDRLAAVKNNFQIMADFLDGKSSPFLKIHELPDTKLVLKCDDDWLEPKSLDDPALSDDGETQIEPPITIRNLFLKANPGAQAPAYVFWSPEFKAYYRSTTSTLTCDDKDGYAFVTILDRFNAPFGTLNQYQSIVTLCPRLPDWKMPVTETLTDWAFGDIDFATLDDEKPMIGDDLLKWRSASTTVLHELFHVVLGGLNTINFSDGAGKTVRELYHINGPIAARLIRESGADDSDTNLMHLTKNPDSLAQFASACYYFERYNINFGTYQAAAAK